MTRKPQTTAEAVAYLYDRLDIASRPTSWIAHALQVIEIEHERLAARAAPCRAAGTTHGGPVDVRVEQPDTG